MIVTTEEFIKVMVDCKGYSAQEAAETAEEYNNNLGNYIKDIGGDEESILEAKAFLNHSISCRKSCCKITVPKI